MKIGITESGDAAIHYDRNWYTQVDGIILITKSPSLLLEKVGSGLPRQTIIHCTITGMGGSPYEPNVKPAEEELEAYQSFLRFYGPDRVVLRIDPIIPFGKPLAQALAVAKYAKGRVRISFLDAYRHVHDRINRTLGADKNLISYFYGQEFHAPLAKRMDVLETFKSTVRSVAEASGWDYRGIEVCGEPNMGCSGCVSRTDLLAMLLDPMKLSGKYGAQRQACCCLAEKVELIKRRQPCPFGCLYCYWKG